MAAITKQEQSGSLWHTWISTEGLNTVMLITNNQITEEEALAIQTKWLSDHLYDSIPQEVVSIYDYREVIRNAVEFIKIEEPNLTEWNTYLGTLAWDDALMVRWFLAMLAKKLANRGEITLSSYTENQVLAELRVFIVNTPIRRLEKIIFGA